MGQKEARYLHTAQHLGLQARQMDFEVGGCFEVALAALGASEVDLQTVIDKQTQRFGDELVDNALERYGLITINQLQGAVNTDPRTLREFLRKPIPALVYSETEDSPLEGLMGPYCKPVGVIMYLDYPGDDQGHAIAIPRIDHLPREARKILKATDSVLLVDSQQPDVVERWAIPELAENIREACFTGMGVSLELVAEFRKRK